MHKFEDGNDISNLTHKGSQLHRLHQFLPHLTQHQALPLPSCRHLPPLSLLIHSFCLPSKNGTILRFVTAFKRLRRVVLHRRHQATRPPGTVSLPASVRLGGKTPPPPLPLPVAIIPPPAAKVLAKLPPTQPVVYVSNSR